MPVIQGLGWTFDTVSATYEKLRPGYVDALYQQIFSYCPVNENSRAIEVGIGGGQATEPVLRTGCQVLAVEPGENFCRLCTEKFRAYPGFSTLNGRFEEAELPRESADLIFSATAFHWVPEEIGYRKVFDTLKSGGAFARFANHPYNDKSRPGMHEAIQAVYDVYMPRPVKPTEYTEEKAIALAQIAEKYGFVDIQHHLYHRTRDFTADEYIQLLGTYSDHIAIEENTRRKFFGEIRDAINGLGGVITIFDTIDLQLARKP